ncbi:MAG TPA: trehalose-6-phosphate synthase [Actinomycetes bacterium]|nr:trehalose-6-phosphate synthase [Actinomycetes bacterium]
MPSATTVLVANRGPVSFRPAEDDRLHVVRGGGGLVSGLSGADEGSALVVCAALSDSDRHAVRRSRTGRLEDLVGVEELGGTPVRMLDLDPVTFTRAYQVVANSTLWFAHHMLWSAPSRPVFDRSFARDWEAYEAYNAAFADAVSEEAGPGAHVLVQDYHLTLVPEMLRTRRPDLRIGHFSHTPWAPPEYFRLLPERMGRAILEGLLGADSVGFHTRRWAEAFVRCCADTLGAGVDGRADDGPLSVRHHGRRVRVDVNPLGVDAPALRARAAARDVEVRLETLREQVADLRVLVRVDRTELSKNIVRGLLAYRELLLTQPQWRGRVVHLAFAYPSRHDLPEYRAYTAEVMSTARAINDELGSPGWAPVLLHVEDDYARSLAAYRMADVLLVNPLRDGMNLVAKEGPVLAERGCALVLSREAGAVDQLGEGAFLVNPFDVSGTAEALHAALSLPEADRRERAKRLAEAAGAHPPSAWLRRQLDALA